MWKSLLPGPCHDRSCYSVGMSGSVWLFLSFIHVLQFNTTSFSCWLRSGHHTGWCACSLLFATSWWLRASFLSADAMINLVPFRSIQSWTVRKSHSAQYGFSSPWQLALSRCEQLALKMFMTASTLICVLSISSVSELQSVAFMGTCDSASAVPKCFPRTCAIE